jgi:hypothetical protein
MCCALVVVLLLHLCTVQYVFMYRFLPPAGGWWPGVRPGEHEEAEEADDHHGLHERQGAGRPGRHVRFY